MAKQIELAVAPREVMGKATKHLRKVGMIPANISGHKQPSRAIEINALEFERTRRAHGSKNIFTLRFPDATKETALLRRVQHDPVKGHILHVDFGRVSLHERITTKIPLHLVGEAPAVKVEGGILLHLLDALEVECRASDIVEAFEVDISPLKEIDSILHARDVKLPANYTLITDPAEPIAKVGVARVAPEVIEAEEAAAATAAAAAAATAEAAAESSAAEAEA
jgi:large subunit ribosomal protein L25